jgi:TPR repeat protein
MKSRFISSVLALVLSPLAFAQTGVIRPAAPPSAAHTQAAHAPAHSAPIEHISGVAQPTRLVCISASPPPPDSPAGAAYAAIQQITERDWYPSRLDDQVLRVVGASSADALRGLAATANPCAATLVWDAYSVGVGGFEKNESEAERWLSHAVETGDPVAQFWAGHAYLFGIGQFAKNIPEGVRLTRLSAAQNFPVAISWLGGFYAQDEPIPGITKNYAEAVRLMRLAMNLGSLCAPYSLAGWYETGTIGLSQSMTEAQNLYQESASRGCDEAIDRVAYDLIYGNHGVAKDEARGYSMLQRAADDKDTRAESTLGFCYIEGRCAGVPVDAARGQRMIEDVIAQGADWTANSQYAQDLIEGSHLPRNVSRGLQLLRDLTSSSNEMARGEGYFQLGLLYEYGGSGAVARDRQAAIENYRQAAQLGVDAARDALREMGVQ